MPSSTPDTNYRFLLECFAGIALCGFILVILMKPTYKKPPVQSPLLLQYTTLEPSTDAHLPQEVLVVRYLTKVTSSLYGNYEEELDALEGLIRDMAPLSDLSNSMLRNFALIVTSKWVNPRIVEDVYHQRWNEDDIYKKFIKAVDENPEFIREFKRMISNTIDFAEKYHFPYILPEARVRTDQGLKRIEEFNSSLIRLYRPI